MLGLRCREPAFASCSQRGLLFVAALALLIAVASPVGMSLRVMAHRLISCGVRA